MNRIEEFLYDYAMNTIERLTKSGISPDKFKGHLVILSMDGRQVAVNNAYHKHGFMMKENYNILLDDYFKIQKISLSYLRGKGMNSCHRLGFVPLNYPWSAIPILSKLTLALSPVIDSDLILYNGIIFIWDGLSKGILPDFDKEEYLSIIKLWKQKEA